MKNNLPLLNIPNNETSLKPDTLKSKKELKKIRKELELVKRSEKLLIYQDFIKKINLIQQPNSLTQTYLYEYYSNNKYKYTLLGNHIIQLLNEFFGSFYYLIGRPVLLHTQRKLSIFINYYKPGVSPVLTTRHFWRHNILPSNNPLLIYKKIKRLSFALSKLLGKKVVIQLNRLKYPYHDSHILSKFISLSANSSRFARLIRIIFKKASVITRKIKDDKTRNDFYLVTVGKRTIKIHKSVPSVLTGLKIKISGRLMTERVVPKRTVKKREIGGFSKSKNSIVDYSIYTNKNKRGSYSVKIWTTNRILRKRY